MSKPLPKRLRYAADHKNYACVDSKCKAHHDAEYLRVDLHESALITIRQEERRAAFKDAVAIIVGQSTAHYIYSGATPMAAETFRDNAIGAIEAVIAIEQAKQSKLEAAANETREGRSHGPTN